MKTTLMGGLIALLSLASFTGRSAPVDRYNIVWDSPSPNHHGSMPLGNGDIALNAWMTRDGDLHFYIGKTDAWDDNARLVKVGKVRVHFEPNPVAADEPYRQALKLNEGCLEITTGKSAECRLRLWVDAHHPVIHLTADSVTPFEATAVVEIWRTHRQELTELQTSDVLLNLKTTDQKQVPAILEPDTVLSNQPNRIGWLHHNIKSVGPRMLAEIQGLTGFGQPDPLLHRTFGAMITADKGQRLDDRRLRSPRGASHRFSVFVLTRHPSTPQGWLADMEETIRRVESQAFDSRLKAHEAWWRSFWARSWIRASASENMQGPAVSIVPTNSNPVRIGMDQRGESRFRGEIGRLTILGKPLAQNEIAAAADPDRRASPLTEIVKSALANTDADNSVAFAMMNPAPQILSNSTAWHFPAGFTLEAWVKPEMLDSKGARVVDKITSSASDGFLLDSFPGNSLRLICGEIQLQQKDALPAGQWTHIAAVADSAAEGCRLYLNGKSIADTTGAAVGNEAFYVSQMYHLQRFITACAGRGAYPIKFNGTLFTVPPGPTEQDPDYRRWGPGYWWQNTRLPYISLCASGDFDLQRPLFRMYAEDLLSLCKYRTKLYLGHDGAFYPECIMFWGAVFSETYGWTPFGQRQDKLQESGWHKWEWVGGLELAWMMLDYFDHTLDRDFLQKTALPYTREVLSFFDQHYPVNAEGKLVMHPSQALETWWQCTNATPELAGCVALTQRLLALPAVLAPPLDHELWSRLQAKLPPIPLREILGQMALAPAEAFADKRNIENPELYPVFPFRLFAFNRPNAHWALAALEHRWDRGNRGWRQDDIFMAYLGQTEDARKAIVSRARSYDRGERFPAFWGPNYDWTPDQDHGGVLMKAFQAMLMQTDGEKIFLLPAWPRDWDVEFKLHAPQQTVIEGIYRDGKMVSMKVAPDSRRDHVIITP
ncbi:MAG TPA: DUF5703 domain-containing protein [Verrucomicrobiota bacterium]|nr:DUF5703 domain-containing protein [Verrucomicrobiota bacterium]